MSDPILNFKVVKVDPEADVVRLVTLGNVDTTLSARAWWFSDDATIPARTALFTEAQPFTVSVAEIKSAKVRRLMFRFIAAQGNPPERHLVAIASLDEVPTNRRLVSQVFEEDLPPGHNNWTFVDAVTLEV